VEYIKWTPELSVGVTLLDAEHRKLVEMVNTLNQLILSGNKTSVVDSTLAGLLEYTKIHFRNEEDLMKKYGYPLYEKHKKEHDELTSAVKEFIERLQVSVEANFSLELLAFLREWLVNHIKGSDMKYKAFFNSMGIS
jgi:hemerythrin